MILIPKLNFFHHCQVKCKLEFHILSGDMNNCTYIFNFAKGCGGPLMLTERSWKLTERHLYANKWSSSYISVDWTTAPGFFVIKRIMKLDRSYISAEPMAELHHAISKVIKKTFFNSLLFIGYQTNNFNNSSYYSPSPYENDV